MLKECIGKPHDYKSVHEGLIGGQMLVQCQNCKTIAVMWSAVLHKEQTKYKKFLEKNKAKHFGERVKRFFGG